jgi:hypothetical protein
MTIRIGLTKLRGKGGSKVLSIKKDKTATISDPIYNDDWYVVDDYELEEKILRGFPNIEWVLDEQGQPIDVTFTVPVEPTLPEQVQSLTEENQMLVDCILEMSEIIYGGE